MKKFLFFSFTLILILATAMLASCSLFGNNTNGGGDNTNGGDDESGAAMAVKLEIVVPGDKIYTFKNTTDKFDNGKKTVYLKAYLDYLAAEEGLIVKIDSAGYVEGFYNYNPDRNTEYFKIYVDGKTSNYGVKTLKLKDGEKYSFIPEKVVSGGNYAASKYPDFLADSDYWLPTQGVKDVSVKILFLDETKTFSMTTEKTYIGEVCEELTAAEKADIEFAPDYGFGISIDMVDGVKYIDWTYFWQVYCGYGASWEESFEDNEVYNLTGFAVDWSTMLPDTSLLPGYVFDGVTIFIRLTAA